MPNIARATVVNGVGIAGYDHTKQTVVKLLGEGQGDSMTARFAGGLLGGFSTAIAGCPFDVLKTRMMNQWSAVPATGTAHITAAKSAAENAAKRTIASATATATSATATKAHPALLHAHTKPLYDSLWHCFVSVVRHEGVLALWKGVFPVYCRQAPFNMFHYMIMEQLTTTVLGKSL